MATDAERAAMRRADVVSRRGLGRTSPNPVVGAVVLDAAGRAIAEGHHERAGTDHAEVVALRAAGAAARGGTVVVTLEPCSHDGRTPPCVDAITGAGVARVVYAVPDPIADHSGGAAALHAAGVSVEAGVEADLVESTNEAWLTAVRRHRPFVTLKLATTLDGRVAAADGSSQWITSADARHDAHLLRAVSDAIVVGVGTVLADDPQLTARGADGRPLPYQPLRVVLDSRGRTPADARVRDAAAETLIAGADNCDRVDLKALLSDLYDRGVRHVLVEGGPRVATSFVDHDLVDRVVAYVALALMGSGRSALDGGLGTPTIAALRRLRIDDVTRVGPDLRIVARPAGG